MRVTQHQSFPNTHWSLVRRAGLSDEESQKQALTTLLERYRPALQSYLATFRGIDEDQAEDILQAFIADKMLQREFLTHANERRGQFRVFLAVSLNNFVLSWFRRQKVRKTDLYSEYRDPRDSFLEPATILQTVWARSLLKDVIAEMKAYCGQRGRENIWIVFESRLLSYVDSGSASLSYEELQQRLKLASPAQAANLLVTGKRLFERLLRDAIREYEMGEAAIDAEIRDLRILLARAGLKYGDEE